MARPTSKSTPEKPLKHLFLFFHFHHTKSNASIVEPRISRHRWNHPNPAKISYRRPWICKKLGTAHDNKREEVWLKLNSPYTPALTSCLSLTPAWLLYGIHTWAYPNGEYECKSLDQLSILSSYSSFLARLACSIIETASANNQILFSWHYTVKLWDRTDEDFLNRCVDYLGHNLQLSKAFGDTLSKEDRKTTGSVILNGCVRAYLRAYFFSLWSKGYTTNNPLA